MRWKSADRAAVKKCPSNSRLPLAAARLGAKDNGMNISGYFSFAELFESPNWLQVVDGEYRSGIS
jgi:hypothetical protein